MSPDPYSARRLGDRLLLEVVDSACGDAARRAGAWCACRVGCTECCQGPFPVNALDAWRLREGLAELAGRDRRRAEAVLRRAEEAVDRMTPGFPGDVESGALEGDEAAEDAFFERHRALPCPALDPVTGACDLYEWRPISCRTSGPPVRFGEQDLPPCRLWFQGAPADAVEPCRVEPDPQDQERDLLESLDGDRVPADTFVAFALTRAADR